VHAPAATHPSLAPLHSAICALARPLL